MERTTLNRIEWPTMPAFEDYVDARAAFEKLGVRVQVYSRALSEFSDALRGTPGEAIAAIPKDWRSEAEIRDLLKEASAAFDNMNQCWGRLPQPQQEIISTKPLTALGPFYDPRR
jgi:hypothetical protein